MNNKKLGEAFANLLFIIIGGIVLGTVFVLGVKFLGWLWTF